MINPLGFAVVGVAPTMSSAVIPRPGSEPSNGV